MENQPRPRVACLFLTEMAGQREEDFQALAEACLQFSPKVAVRMGEAIFLEAGSLKRICPEDILSRKLEGLSKKWEWPARVSFGSDPAAALAMARFLPNLKNPMNLPLEALYDYADPFSANGGMREWVSEMIQFLGVFQVSTLGEFIQIPIVNLGARFGKESVELARRVRGQAEVVWPGFHPPERIMEAVELESELGGAPIEAEALFFILKKLADRAVTRLRARVERASKVGVSLGLEKGTMPLNQPQWQIELPVPQGTVSGLLPILREKISFELQRKPIQSAVQKIGLEILEAVPGRGSQRDFFHRKEEETEEWDALMGRLSQKLGRNRVFRAKPAQRYLPEKAWARQEVLSVAESHPQQSSEVSCPARPARILEQPELLRRNGRLLIHPSGKAWRVFRWDGPERISGEWWKNPKFDAFNRDYYRVFVETGEQLWVFSSRHADGLGLYLHGYFD